MRAKKVLFATAALVIFLAKTSIGQEQKKNLSVDDLKNEWPHVAFPLITPDGRYASYTIFDQPQNGLTLYIKSLSDAYLYQYVGGRQLAFTSDSKVAFFIVKDTLYRVNLNKRSITKATGIKRFELASIDRKQHLLYLSTDGTLHIEPLGSKEQTFSGVESYLLSKTGDFLLLKKSGVLALIDTRSYKETNVYEGKTGNFILDKKGSTIAFDTKDDNAVTYHIFREGKIQSVPINTLQNPDSMLITGLDHFSEDGTRLFVKLQEKPMPKPADTAVMVDVWSWRDRKLQSQQLADLQRPQTYLGLLDLDKGILKRLQFDGEVIANAGPLSTNADSVYLVIYDDWNKQKLRNIWTGKEKELPFKRGEASPDGKYICFLKGLTLLSYEVKTERVVPYFKMIPDTISHDYPLEEKMKLLGWASSNIAIYYDQYDLWAVDIRAINNPINLTNGYGRKHQIMFRPLNKDAFANGLELPLNIYAYNTQTKDNGFYQIVKGGQDPVKLSMGPFAYGMTSASIADFKDFKVVKAADKNLWIVSRESLAECENYFTTSDFKNFRPLSGNHPEQAYNWLNNELINFKTLDGKSSQSILYKPENFDPHKKYPVIITYYEKLTQRKNHFPRPEIPGATINIPWEVSRGYLVLTPDIYYAEGKAGASALNAVEGAVNEISKLPYVDTVRIGIIGHSFGGFETNYIVTHSDRYKCAIASSAASSMITTAINLTYGGNSLIDYVYEPAFYRMNNFLLQEKRNYIDNSPILSADKINTPLLLMSNKRDGIVNFTEGIAMYQVLKHQNKPVWVLQYDNEGHTISDVRAGVDRLKRFDQYFDHYLQDKPAPKWMTEGVPARYKGIRTGYELDKGTIKP